MEKENKIIIFVIGAVLLALGAWQSGIFANIFQPQEPVVMPEGIVLFFGADCPHCKVVDEFINENKVEEKVSFTKLEIPFNGKTSPKLRANSKLLVQAAQRCNMDTRGGVSIPFLYDGDATCVLGDVDVINFLKNKAGLQAENP